MCNVCNLNVKSEALWEGHLKSANHRKNVAAQASRQASMDAATGKGVKRKIEDVDEVQEERDEADTDSRKKPKSRPMSTVTESQDGPSQQEPIPRPADDPAPQAPPVTQVPEAEAIKPQTNGTSAATPTVDEDEWAAFEREVAPLAADKPDYSTATITAAPVTADQDKAQEDEERRLRLETEAADEKEEEMERLAEEFDVMEEMEERMRKLREKREALRITVKPGDDTGQSLAKGEDNPLDEGSATRKADDPVQDEDEENDDDDEDDWYS